MYISIIFCILPEIQVLRKFEMHCSNEEKPVSPVSPVTSDKNSQ